eukprot:TRINITY_DN10724_c0_g1_i1.p1 TRINITY_DN10724_c0_g1~~TRINITY_DN10724_c0_g1_i1.p1  ORF type:complete len:436 (-),score=54.43 TRINITY_DN10724_c0_g1_i1:282-1589(-)
MIRPSPLNLSLVKRLSADLMARAPTTSTMSSSRDTSPTRASTMDSLADTSPHSSNDKAVGESSTPSQSELRHDLPPTTSDAACSLPKHQGVEVKTLPQSQGEINTVTVGKEHAEVDSLEKCIQEAGNSMPWNPGSFRLVASVLKEPRNQSEVQQMEWLSHGFVAVKRMPISFTKLGYNQFVEENDAKISNPWLDIGILQHLNKTSYPYVPDHLGVFQSCSETFTVSSLAVEGDLFSWIHKDGSLPKPGLDREEVLWPIKTQIAVALQTLHLLGIAHLNVSMESILLTRGTEGEAKVQLTEFGLACLHRSNITGARGKPSYIAPELHSDKPCSSYACDVFSLGVVMYCLALGRYPWMSTQPGLCKKFMYGQIHGLRALLKKSLVDRFTSPCLTDILESVLAIEPCHREPLMTVIKGMRREQRMGYEEVTPDGTLGL